MLSVESIIASPMHTIKRTGFEKVNGKIAHNNENERNKIIPE
jgi:hypothetical protein